MTVQLANRAGRRHSRCRTAPRVENAIVENEPVRCSDSEPLVVFQESHDFLCVRDSAACMIIHVRNVPMLPTWMHNERWENEKRPQGKLSTTCCPSFSAFYHRGREDPDDTRVMGMVCIIIATAASHASLSLSRSLAVACRRSDLD